MANTCNFYNFYACPNSRCIYLQCIAILHQIGGLNGRLTVQTWVLLSAFACSSLDIVDMAGKTKIIDPKIWSLQRHLLLEQSWPI